MHSSSSAPISFGTVVKADDAVDKVLDFSPPKIELGTLTPAKGYLTNKKQTGTDFRMSDVIRIQTGIKEIETDDQEEVIEKRTLERLQSVQEGAYQEAYQLGLQEGRQEAFRKMSVEIESKLEEFQKLLMCFENIKRELMQFNEKHIVELTVHFAARLAATEVKANPEVIRDSIKAALEMAQAEEEVTVKVCPEQLEFIETLRNESKKDNEFLKKVKLIPSEEVSVGGCIVETNYGTVDARMEERVKKLWEEISENLYKVKDVINVA